MKVLKNLGLAILIISIFSVMAYFYAKSDYEWADVIIEQETEKGGILIATLDNSSSITNPWTIFKTPVTSLWFADKNNIKKIKPNEYLVKIIHVSYNYTKTEKDDNMEIINIKNQESAFIDEKQNINNLDYNKLKWNKYGEGTPGHQIIKYFTNYEKNF